MCFLSQFSNVAGNELSLVSLHRHMFASHCLLFLTPPLICLLLYLGPVALRITSWQVTSNCPAELNRAACKWNWCRCRIQRTVLLYMFPVVQCVMYPTESRLQPDVKRSTPQVLASVYCTYSGILSVRNRRCLFYLFFLFYFIYI